ncbi:lonely Cys domain-containing protein [Streptomyces sp. NEAU-S77]|uniref:lonely Cys domain-containing protein n=1 Tax=Streptomyces sp. NEAU-S77 TaxID=3411033 RepID=UPI003B9FA361
MLPAPAHAAQADARYAGDAYRAAVRDVAEHLLDHGPDARSAVELADMRRRELGLRPRWTEAAPPAPEPRPRPVVSSAPAMPDLDMPDLDTSDVDMFEAIEVSESSSDESVFSEGSASDSDTSVYSDSSDEDAPAPDPGPKPASRTALPSQAEVRFAKAALGLSDDEVTKLRGLARHLALAGLRNRRAGLPLPEILITGYGNDLRSNDELLARQTAAQDRGNRRARTVSMTLTYELGRVLRALQRNRPDGEQLSSGHFSVGSRGVPLVPGNKRVAQAPLPTRIDISTAPRAKAAETLDGLRRQEKRLRHGPMDVSSLAGSILHLPAGAEVDQAVRDELFDLVLEADKAGRAASLAALGAFHAQRQGVLDARHRFNGAQGDTGLNWTGTGSVEVDTATVELAEKNRQGVITRLRVDDAQPWEGDESAFVVAAKGDRNKVVVPWPDNTTRDLGIEEFAELLAHDPVLSKLPEDVPIVLAVPHAGYGLRYLPRLLAHLTGRTVYVHSGDVQVVVRPGQSAKIRVTRHKGKRQGDWVPNFPGRHPGSPDDVPLWYHDVETSAIVSKLTKKVTGQSAFAPDDLADFREEYLRRIDQMKRFAHFNPATGTRSSTFFTPADPDEAAPAVYQSAHGYPGGISVTMENGDTRRLDGPETEKWARAQRVLLSAFPKGHWGDLDICWAGSHRDGRVPQRDHAGSGFPGPYVADPLEDVPVGQLYANGLRRKIRCNIRVSGMAHEDDPNRIYFRMLYTDPRGRWSVRAKFFPEPRTGELVRRARAIGFVGPDGKVSKRDRKRTLRLVRALKLALGNEVDDGVRIEEEPGYAELLRGAAALDRMWHADGRFGAAGPFTMELFHRIVAAKLPAGQSEARRADYHRVLLEAANAADGTRLGEFVTLPPAVDAASVWKDGHAGPADFDRVVASMLGVPVSDVNDGHRMRAFWARVKAHELLDRPGLDVEGLARKALHLAVADSVGDARREDLWRLVGMAFARGRDATDPDVLGAFHLERSAPFDDLVADPELNWVAIGSDWSTGAKIHTLNTSRIETRDGLVDAPWNGRDPGGDEREMPFVVRGTYDPADPYALRLRFQVNGPVFRVPFGEFVELMAYHPMVVDRELNGVLVLDIPGLYDTRLTDLLTERLGRPVTFTRGRTGIAYLSGAKDPVLSLSPSPQLTSAKAENWSLKEPVDPATPTDAPLPVRPVASAASVPAQPAPVSSGTTAGTTSVQVPSADGTESATRVFAAPVASSSALPSDMDVDDSQPSSESESSESDSEESVFSEFTGSSDSETSEYSDSSDDESDDESEPAPKPVSRTGPSPQTGVSFLRGSAALSPVAKANLRELARRLAVAGLRNQRAGAPLPPVHIAGYGNDVPANADQSARQAAARELGARRAQAVYATLGRELARALTTLQQNRPAGEPRLTSAHFTMRSRGVPLVPAAGAVVQSPQPTQIQISLAPSAKAAEILDVLRRQEKRLRHGPMDVSSLARRILHPPAGTTVDQDLRNQLFDLVVAADREGRATSLAALGAFHAQRQGVLDARHWFTDAQGNPTGLNWTGTGAVALDTATVERIEKDQGKPTGQSKADPPWAGDKPAFVVAAKGDRHKIVVPWPDGTTRELGIEEFAELLAHDPVLSKLPKDVPIVLAVPYAGHGLLHLPGRLAHRTGHLVYPHSGDVGVVSRLGQPSIIQVTHHKGRRQGDWVPNGPELDPGSLDDMPAWYHEVETSAIVSATTGRRTGYSAYPSADMADGREEKLRHIDQTSEFLHYDPAAHTYVRRFTPSDPDEAAPAFYLGAHGFPGGIVLPSERLGSLTLDGPETEKWARAQRVLLSVHPKGHWGDLEICWAGSPRNGRVPQRDHAGLGFPGPYVADPLEDVPIGQHYANGLRWKVRCTIRITGIDRDGQQNRIYFRVLYTDPQGRTTARAKFFPEPRTGELVRRALVVGFVGPDGKVSEQDRKRTLRLVRALKLALGNEVDDRVRIEEDPDYAELLCGAAALDRMWHADGRFGAAGPFTMELFHRIVAAKLPAGRTEARRADYHRVLLEAANAAGDTRLGDFVTLPPAVDAASVWKDGHAGPADFDRVVASMLGVPVSDVNDGHRMRAFWARVKAHELLDRPGLDVDGLARKALHLAAADSVGDARRKDLWRLVGMAFARGRDATDPDALAAFHLETAGAFSNPLTNPLVSGDGIGHDWTAGTKIQTLDTSRILTPGGMVPAPWFGKDPKDRVRAAPSVVRGSYIPSEPGILHLRFGSNPRVFRVPFAEFVELMAYHPMLVDRDLTSVLVLDIAGLHDDSLADTLKKRLGRPVTFTRATTGTAQPEGLPHPVLSLMPSAQDPQPTAQSWGIRQPVAPATLETAPVPVQPVPSSARPNLTVPETRPQALPPSGAPADGGQGGLDPAGVEGADSIGLNTLPPAAVVTAGIPATASAVLTAADQNPDSDPDSDPDSGSDSDSAPEPDPESDSESDSELESDSDSSDDPDDETPANQGLSALVTRFGRGHRGLQGSVHVMPFPEDTLTWLHAHLSRTVRAEAAAQLQPGELEAQNPADTAALEQDIAAQYSADEVLDALPHVLSGKGMSRTVTYRGRKYQVSARLELFGHQPAPTMADDTPEGRRVHIEERNRTAVDTSDTSSTGNVRSLPLSYGRTWLVHDSRNPAVASQTFTPKLTLTHNQQVVTMTVPENYTAMSALAFSSEPSHAYDYGMSWQFTAVLAPSATAPTPHTEDDWSDAEISPARLAAWFPHYLTQTMPPRPYGPVSPHDLPADPRTLTDELPLYRMDTIHDPSELLDVFLAAPQLRPHLRRMSDESATALRAFLDENNRRSGLPLMLAGAYPSPILLDRGGEPLGYLEVSARINSLSPDALARSSKKLVLESDLLHLVGAKTALTVSNAEKAEFTVTTTFQGAPSPDGNFVFGGGYKHQRSRTLNSGGTAYDWFSLVSENPHLLTDADITYTATLVLPKGGRTAPFTLPSPQGQSMRVPTLADVTGTPVEPGQERHLPPELASLRALGVNTTPLKITGTGPLFDQLETLLRTMGFLAPSTPQRLDWLHDSAILMAWLANARKLTIARSQIGLRGALGAIMDGGHPLYFDLPLEHGVWRVSADLSVAPTTGTSPDHRKNLPGWSLMNANGMGVAGSESSSSSQSLFGNVSAEISGPAPHHWTVAGGIPSSASATRQITGDTSGSAAGYSLDLLTYAQSGLGVFDIPGTFTMRVFSENGDTPLATFTPEDGIVSVAVPLSRTLDAPAAPLGPVTIRRAKADDFRKARMTPGADGTRPQDVVLLPGQAHVNLAMGSGALTTAFRQLLGGIDPEAEEPGEPGALARILQWASSHGSDLIGQLPSAITAFAEPARWLKDMTVGKSMTDAESPVQEALRAASSSTSLISRSPQIFRGGYVVDADTSGTLVGTEVQGEIRGFLHNAVYEGTGHPGDNPDAATYAENDLTSTDSSWRGTTSGRSEQIATSLTGSHTGERPGSVSGSGGRNTAVARSRTDTDAAFTDRITAEAHAKDRFHGFRVDATYLVLLRKGHRNAVANAVGVGPHSSVAYAVTVPGGVVFWATETLVRQDPQLTRLAGLEPLHLPMDRLLPRYFARAGGRSLGFATVPEALPTGSLDEFTEAIRDAVEREAPDSLTPGRGRFVRGLDARITEAGAVTGMRSLASAGARHWRRFHFPYRGRTGLHLVEVSLNARPAPGTDLAALRGALLAYSGLENINSASASAITSTASRSTGFTLTLSGTGGFTLTPDTDRTGSAASTASFTSAGTRGTSRTITRNHQEWPRTFRPAAQFQVPYEYRVEVTSARLNDSALGFLTNRVVSMGQLVERLLDGALSAADTAGLTHWMDGALGRDTAVRTQNTPAPATVTLRFPGSEAPPRREDGTPELPAPPPVLITPHVHRADPRPAATPAGTPDRDPLSGTARWTPNQPITVYDFDATDELADALREVDPELRGEGLPKTSTSAENTMRRLGDLIRRGKIELTPAQASRYTGKQPSGGSARIALALYRPQMETSSRDVLSQGLRTTVAAHATTGSRTISPSVTAPVKGGLTDDNTDTLAGTVPVAGENTALGQAAGGTGFRREVLKYGTPTSENTEGEPDDSGVLGYTLTAHTVLEVSGPRGTRWVTGNVVLRPTLEDVLGLGITPARPSPAVYDAPAVLAGHGIDDWRALRPEEFGDRLAEGFADQDARAQVWLDAGEVTADTRRTLNAVRQALRNGATPEEALNTQGVTLPADLRLALDAADRAADRARRPVELVLRTVGGPVHLPFTPGPLHGWASEMPVPSIGVTEPVPEIVVTPPRNEPAPDRTAATRLTTPVVARPVLTRHQLEGVTNRLASIIPPGAMSAQRCLRLAEALRDAVFPGGVRIAGTVDDSVTLAGPDAAATGLVAGPGWRPVRSWHEVARAVADAGPGALAIVLARRQGGEPGHVWAAYNMGGRSNRVVALDPSAREGRRVSAAPPDMAPLEAQAVVIDRAGRVLENALPGFTESASLGHALADRSVEREYGALGLEVEDRHILDIRAPEEPRTLAVGPGVRFVTEPGGFWRDPATGQSYQTKPEVAPGASAPEYCVFGRVVADPAAAPAGASVQSPEEVLARLQSAQHNQLTGHPDGLIPVMDLLADFEGWEVSDSGLVMSVTPGLTDRAHPGRLVLKENEGEKLLARGPGIDLYTDIGVFWRDPATGRLTELEPEVAPGAPRPVRVLRYIVEFVIDPMAVLQGEDRQLPENALDQLELARRALDTTDERDAVIPLADLLEDLEGWEVTEVGRRTHVAPHLPDHNHRAYTQPTPGIPTIGLRALQEVAARRLSKAEYGRLLTEGREFGASIAKDFLLDVMDGGLPPDSLPLLPFLSAIPDVDEVWGYEWLSFNHVAATPASLLLPGRLVKNLLPVAGRHPFDRTLRALRPRTREFLDGRYDEIAREFAERLRSLLEIYRRVFGGEIAAGFFDAPSGDGPAPREHLTATLTGRTSSGDTVGQYQTIGMTDYPALDTDDGRLAVALLLKELRHFGFDDRMMTREQIRQSVAELSVLSRRAYERALRHRAPLPLDVLRLAITRIRNNPVVRAFSPFLGLAQLGVPQANGPARKLLTWFEFQTIAEDLGSYALGSPLPTDAQRRLREAVRTAADLLAQVPPGQQARIRQAIEGAWRALGVLADPSQLPPVVSMAPEVVAVDGTRVPVERLSAVKYQDPQGKPVAFSSRPARDGDGRESSYGLLPQVRQFTFLLASQAYQGPSGVVVPESDPMELPFGKAYLVDIGGDGALAELGMRDGSGKVFDYGRVVDFLYAADPDLIALDAETAVLVTGADVAGPPPYDPLERPIAAEVLANWAGELWTTGSGRRPGIVPGDGRSGPRFQLAEGDWWVGFRPKPSSAELARLAERVTGDRKRAGDVLRWVRAIRLVYGPMLEDDTAAFEALLHGFRALDEARAVRGDRSPLTWRGLRHEVGAYVDATGAEPLPLNLALPLVLLSAAGSLGRELKLSGLDLSQRCAPVRAWEQATAPYGAPVSAQGFAVSAQGPGGSTARGFVSPGPASFAPTASTTPAPQRGAAAAPTTPYDAEAHVDQILRGLVGQQPAPTAAREALRRLNVLRAGVPTLRGGPLDFDALVRHVLMLDPGTAVTRVNRAELMRVALDPTTGNVRSLAQLSAHYLKLNGALAAEFRWSSSDGRARGIDWTGGPRRDIDVDHIWDYTTQPDGTGTGTAGNKRTAPWHRVGAPAPYLLMGSESGDGRQVRVRGRQGFSRMAPYEVVMELMALDDELSALPSDVPLLSLTSWSVTYGLKTVRDGSALLGRDLWNGSGFVAIVPLPNQPGLHGIGLVESPGAMPVGGWLLTEHGMPRSHDDGAEEWEQNIITFPVIGRDHRSTGHLSVNLADRSDGSWGKTRLMADLPTMTHYVHYDAATDTLSEPMPVPWLEDDPDADPYFEAKHGLPGQTQWAVTGGTENTSGPRSTAPLKRRPSLRMKPPGEPIVKIVCHNALPPGIGYVGPNGPHPFVPDPLAVISEAQQTANDERRSVYGTRHMVTEPLRTSKGLVVGTDTDVRGRKYGLERVPPEPTESELDDLARQVELHKGPGPATDAIRERMRRLVRLLRRQFGPRVEKAASYPVLLAGAAALDVMLRNDPELTRVPLFTIELLQRVALADHRRQPGGAQQPFGPKSLADVLRRAAERRAQDPDIALTTYVGLPMLVQVVRAMLPPAQFDAFAAQILTLPGPGHVGDAERSQALWTEVRARELLATLRRAGGEQAVDAYAARVLHLDAPDPGKRPNLDHLLRVALAAGRDANVTREVATTHLEFLGAYSDDTLIRHTDGSTLGRDVSGSKTGTVDFDPTTLTLLRRGPDGKLVADSTVQAPWYDPKKPNAPRPMLYRAGRKGDRAEVAGAAVPDEDVGELIYRDYTAGIRPLEAPCVMLIPGARPRSGEPVEASLPGQGALLAGRSMWAAYGTPTLHTDPVTGKTTVALEPDASGRPLTAADFEVVRTIDVRKPGQGFTPASSVTTATGTFVPTAPVQAPATPDPAPAGPAPALGPVAPVVLAPQDDTTAPPAAPSTTPYDAEAHFGQILRGLFGQQPAPTGAREALRRLNALRAGVPALRGGPMDLDAVARHVLMLAENAPVTWDDRGDLLRVAMDPAMENAPSLRRLSAFYLKLKGSLSNEFRFTSANGVRGLNWTDLDAKTRNVDIDSAYRFVQRPDGAFAVVGTPEPAGWRSGPHSPAPYLVITDAKMSVVKVLGRNGFQRAAPKEVVFELLALDEVLSGLPGDVHVLMVISHLNALSPEPVRIGAELLGRPVWSSSGRTLLLPLSVFPWMGIGLDMSEDQAFLADWLLTDPGMARRDDDGSEEWEQRVLSFPVVGPDHRSIGHLSLALSEPSAFWRKNTLMALDLPTMTHFVHLDPATGEVSPPQPLPWVEAGEPMPYFEVKHGDPGVTYWALHDGERLTTSGSRTSGALKRRRSLDRLPKENPVARIACHSAALPGIRTTGVYGPPPFVPDPLAVVSEAQQQANDERRVRYGFLSSTSPRISRQNGDFIGAFTDPRGRVYRPVAAVPEPGPAELDDLARDAGMYTGPGPVPEEVRDRARRLVRLLRRATNPRIGTSAEFPELWRGIGALDVMLRNDPELAGVPLFTVDLFVRVVLAYQAQQPAGSQLTGPDAATAVLKRAGERRAQEPRPALTDFVRLPVVAEVAAMVARPDFDNLTVSALQLSGTDQVGDAERSRMLWAEVAVRELLYGIRQEDPQNAQQRIDSAGARMLHLSAPDPARRTEMFQLLRRAAAFGRDLGNPAEVGALHLQTRGALKNATLMATTGGAGIGRDYGAHRTGPIDFDGTKVTLLRRAADGSLVPDSTVQAPWYSPNKPHAPVPWLFRADQQGGLAVIDGPVPHAEVGELFYRDPVLTHHRENVHVILLVEGARPRPGESIVDSMPGQGALLSGRYTWSAFGKPTLYTDPQTGKTTVALEPDASGRPRPITDLGLVRPRDIRGSFGAPAPAPKVLTVATAQAPAPTAPLALAATGPVPAVRTGG